MKYSGNVERVTYESGLLEITAKNVDDAEARFREILHCLDDTERTPDPDLYTPEEMNEICEECNSEWELSHETYEMTEWSEGGL